MNWRPVAELALLLQTDRPLPIFRKLLALKDPRILALHPAYHSVLIEFDPLQTDAATLQTELDPIVEVAANDPVPPGRLVTIPVTYGGEEGPDLAVVAEHHKISPKEVISRHSEVIYEVAFLGFQPGFPYLLGLPKSLAMPRLATPRLRVPAGSVGIAGEQTGIYPLATPGGWQIIGRARVSLFLPHSDPPTLLQAGDRVRFMPEVNL